VQTPRVPAVIPEVTTDNPKTGVQNSDPGAYGFQPSILGGAFPGNYPQSANIAQPNTIFHNMRWWLVTNLRQMLSEAYVELGLVQTICKVPVEDALRGGITIKSKQLDEDQISELTALMDEQGDTETAGEAAEWDRLFGGAAVLIFTEDDPSEPLVVDDIFEGEDIEFRAVDLWELFFDLVSVGSYEEALSDPNVEYFDYYGERIHRTRVLLLKGIKAPSFVRPRLRGWGVSVVETLVTGINQYLKSADLTYEVLDEFKLDIYKINNFASSAFSQGGLENSSVRDRVEMVNFLKNFQNAIVLDKEDEYENKQLSFTGLAEAQAGIRMQIASDMRMPLTKLFGMSAQGFNSGEDDIEVYNGMIESSVRRKLKRPLLQMVKIRCQQLWGFVPDDLQVAFKPLRVMSSTDEETVKTSLFNRALQARQAGELDSDEFADIMNRGELFPIRIKSQKAELGLDDNLDDTIEEDDRPGKGKVNKTKGKDSNTNKPANNTRHLRVMNSRDKAPIIVLPAPYTRGERLVRSVSNSVSFDLASYQADGGDDWIDPAREKLFDDPLGVDQALWTKARVGSKNAFKGEVRWQYTAWLYRKMGGRFSNLN